MRKLTIYRKPTTEVGFSEMDVFAEDPSGEVVLNDYTCRKIGTIKIGDINTFEITEDAVKIILVSEQEGRNGCLEIHQLEAGTNNVSIIGNAVSETNNKSFSGSKSEKSQNHPKPAQKSKVIKRWIVRVLIFTICILLIRNYEPSPKTFTKGGFNITLTSAFENKDDEESFVSFSSKHVMVYVDKYPSYNVEGLHGLSLEEFIKSVSEQSYSNAPITKTDDGLIMIEDEVNSGTRKAVHYYLYGYKTIDAFWTVEFAVRTKNIPKYQEKIEQWARSVEFYK